MKGRNKEVTEIMNSRLVMFEMHGPDPNTNTPSKVASLWKSPDK